MIVFREGLEAVLILAAITASFIGARRRLRRPVLLGALAGLGATAVTYVLAQPLVDALGDGGLRLQAITGLLAIAVLLLVTNWFFHRVYWSEWIGRFNRRRTRARADRPARLHLRPDRRARAARADERLPRGLRDRPVPAEPAGQRRAPAATSLGVAIGLAGDARGRLRHVRARAQAALPQDADRHRRADRRWCWR